MTNHTINHINDETYWISMKRERRTIDPNYLLPGASVKRIFKTDNFCADTAPLIHADGSIKREVDILEPVTDWLVRNQEFDRFHDFPAKEADSLHRNDIDVVIPALAARVGPARSGEYLGRLYRQSKNRPLFVIDEILCTLRAQITDAPVGPDPQ
jgi:hypothetical protein